MTAALARSAKSFSDSAGPSLAGLASAGLVSVLASFDFDSVGLAPARDAGATFGTLSATCVSLGFGASASFGAGGGAPSAACDSTLCGLAAAKRSMNDSGGEAAAVAASGFSIK